MNWILITNNENNNPGDLWVRIGIQRLIRSVDAQAEFEMVDRDVGDAIHVPRHFDRAVVCGMPLIWSHTYLDGTLNTTCTHHAWPALTGWLSEGNRLVVAGFGVYVDMDGPEPRYADATVPQRVRTELFSRCRAVYTRSPLGSRIFTGVTATLCPSVFAGMDLPPVTKDLKLFNSMPNLHHQSYMTPAVEWEQWRKVRGELSAIAMDEGFTFVAHNDAERKEARDLGWPCDRTIVYTGDPMQLLSYYSRCLTYVGNRIHGGAVARSFGAKTLVIGADSRLDMIDYMGGVGLRPTELTKRFRSDSFRDYCRCDHTPILPDIWDSYRQQWAIFAGAMV